MPARKLIRQMLFGITSRKSILLSEIARSLNEETNLLYTEKRLSRNLGGKSLSEENLMENYFNLVADNMDDNWVIAVDISDIQKTYAKRMENLCGVHDGSAGKTANGYWLMQIEAISPDGKHCPLWLEAFSQNRPGYVSHTAQTKAAVLKAKRYIKASPMWVFDRGFDNRKLFDFLESEGLPYVVRQIGRRNIIAKTEIHLMIDYARAMPKPYRSLISSKAKNSKRKTPIEFGSEIIYLPDDLNPKQLIVISTSARKPLMFLTNIMDTGREKILRLILAYIARWGCDEATIFVKQCFDLENIRALRFIAIKRLVFFALLAYSFLCQIVIEGGLAIAEKIIRN